MIIPKLNKQTYKQTTKKSSYETDTNKVKHFLIKDF